MCTQTLHSNLEELSFKFLSHIYPFSYNGNILSDGKKVFKLIILFLVKAKSCKLLIAHPYEKILSLSTMLS